MSDKHRTAIALRLADAMVITTPNGQCKRIDTTCTLDVKDDSLVKMGSMTQKVTDEKGREVERPVFLITAKGWTKLGDQCGVVVFHPDTVVANDRTQPNGYQDPETGRIYFRSVAVGYTPMGQLAISERTVMYDPDLSNLSDLMAKAKSKWGAKCFKLLPFRGKDEHDFFRGAPGDEWAAYRLDQAMVLWVNTSEPDVRKWQGEMLNRKEKALRTCQTFADRNALSAHPATPTQSKTDVSVKKIVCHKWVPEGGGELLLPKSLLNFDKEALMTGAVKADDGRVIDISADTEELDKVGPVLTESDVRDDEPPPPPRRTSRPAPERRPAAPEPEPETAPEPDDEPPPDFDDEEVDQEELPLDGNEAALNRAELLAAAEEFEGALGDVKIKKARAACGVGDGTAVKMLATDKIKELVTLYRAAL